MRCFEAALNPLLRLARAVELACGVPRLPRVRCVDQRDDLSRSARNDWRARAARPDVRAPRALEAVPVPGVLQQKRGAAPKLARGEAEERDARISLQRGADYDHGLVVGRQCEHGTPWIEARALQLSTRADNSTSAMSCPFIVAYATRRIGTRTWRA